QIDKFVDLKYQMADAIETLPNVDLGLVLDYRYLQGMTWEKIAEVMNADVRTIYRWHTKALQLVQMPENPIII
ncbi:sigma factor-like helix-turn-helix DNA-binding protein, partial [Listeria monocytogenes]